MSSAEERRAGWGTHAADAGLRAVARVRLVREEDARLGLQQARAEEAARQGAVAELERRLATRRLGEVARTDDFLAHVAAVAAVGEALGQARGEAATARTVADAAEEHWHDHRRRLEAMEALLQRRLAERREARVRAEARELDDLAGQQWLRRRTEESA